MIESQASQNVNTSVISINPSQFKFNSVKISQPPQPSTSKFNQDFRPHQPSQILASSKNFRVPPLQTLGSSSNLKTIAETPTSDEFRNNLLVNNRLNSTFQAKNVVADPDEENRKKLEKLESENKKLLDDLRIKEGESIYLRKQLNTALTKTNQLSVEKECALERQANQYQIQINELTKKNAALTTQLEFNNHDIIKVADKLKKASRVQSPQNSLLNTSAKKKINQTSQASFSSSTIYKLKTHVVLYPFEEIPPTIFQPSLPEKPIVNIQIVDRSGKCNLPILEDEKTLRIFENPQIVKPMVTVIDKKNLNVEFLHVDIVATTRELLLNILTVLESIKSAMNNDDIRDMNDVYLSDFYDTDVANHQTLCDATEWHEKERGTSQLSPQKQVFINQMTRYMDWSQRKHEHEMLELFNELAMAIHFVRRSHQFTGVICGIAKLISNVQSTVGITHERALNLAGNIFKELVFSHPLLKSLISMTEMMKSFNQSEFFISRLIKYNQSDEMQLFNDINSFNDDDCVLEIYLKQLRSFTLSNVNKVNLMYELVGFADVALKVRHLKLPKEKNSSNRCCKALYEFIIQNLHRCATIDTDELKEEFIRNEKSNFNSLSCWKGKIEGYYWIKFRNKFFNLLKIGIRFLTFVAYWDIEFFVNSPEDIDISIFLFMENIVKVNGFVLSKIDIEALELMKSKFSFDKDETCKLEPETSECKQLFSVKSIFIDEPASANNDNKNISFDRKDNYERTLEMFKSSLQI
ncbi:GSCOCG00007004001-RA-CDS [Cotesia congregata]|nr:GSCOCG00007004001-RA-CDS [Cotesia congregata]